MRPMRGGVDEESLGHVPRAPGCGGGRPVDPAAVPGVSSAATGPITTVVAPRPVGGKVNLADEVGDCPAGVMHGCSVSVRGSAME